MSIIQRDELSDASTADLLTALGGGDTPELFERPYRVETAFDIPFGAGNSVDRRTVYVDRGLYAEVMDGSFGDSGLSPDQIITCWLGHEHSEIVIVQGENPVETYEPAHRRALCWEHLDVLTILGRDGAAEKIARYEKSIWPGLVRCYNRPVMKAPLDLWCAPLLDNPEEQDEEHIKRLQSLGVVDAFKHSKFDIHYGVGPNQCHECQFSIEPREPKFQLSTCMIANGRIRRNRWCEFWKQKAGQETRS
jgi:hypothetical protein